MPGVRKLKLCPGCGQEKRFRFNTCSPECGRKVAAQGSIASPAEKHEHKGSEWEISLDKTRIKTLDQLVKEFEIDLSIWEVERFVCNKWEVGAKDAGGELKTSPLYQVKAWLKKRVAAEFAKNEIADLKREAAKHSPKRFTTLLSSPVKKRGLSGNMVEISLPDIHFGKLAWHGETGSDNYDLTIAIDAFKKAFWALVQRTAPFGVDKFLLPIGNDMFHIDNRSGTTTKGTQVDTDSRYFKIFKKVRKMICEEIETLMQIAPVHVVVVQGNHDEHASWHLGESLECWFRNCAAFTIDNEPKTRKYTQHGLCMIGLWHGNQGKKSNYPLDLATDQPRMFADTEYREVHNGHEHQEHLTELKGIKVRVLPSLSGTDYWHASNGFTHNQRCGMGFVWNDNQGLLSIAYYTFPKFHAEAA